jgi:hypothetical protein
MKSSSAIHKKQSGSVLAISLVLLTAITLISITSMQRSGLQTKIVANIQHHEQLFTTAQSDQEFWYSELKTSDIGDDLLAEALREYIQDAAGIKTYSPVILDPLNIQNYSNAPSRFITVQSSILFTPPQANQIALAQGEEANQRIKFRFDVDSQSTIPRTGRSANQQTGIVFPGLNLAQHSAF